jgi:hypothetical protein
MKPRHALLVCLIVLAGPVCLAGFPTNFFTIHCRDAGYARMDGGKLSLGDSSVNKVPDRRAAPDKWYVGGNQIKSSVGDGYLAYDISGKDPKVFLASRPGKGTEWEVVTHRGEEESATVRAAAGPRPGKGTEWEVVTHRGEEESATVRAAAGPFKGWYLNVKDDRLVLGSTESRAVRVKRFYGHK